jgi:hypothetical protein
MTPTASDFARRIRARSKHIFGCSVRVKHLGSGVFKFIATDPSTRKPFAEEVAIDLQEYAEVFSNWDKRDSFLDSAIFGFLRNRSVLTCS